MVCNNNTNSNEVLSEVSTSCVTITQKGHENGPVLIKILIDVLDACRL